MPSIDQVLEQERRVNKANAERIQELERENTELQKQRLQDVELLQAALNEIETDDRLLEERNRLLRTVPACPDHGDQCVPHAIEWVTTAHAALSKIAERLPSDELQAAILSREPKASEREWHKRLWELCEIARAALESKG